MSGQATSELYSVVNLSKKKTKKTAINQDGDTSDPDIMMYDILNRNDPKDNEAVKDKTNLLMEKLKFLSTFKCMAFIIIMTWIILAIIFIMVTIIYLEISTLKTASVVSSSNQQINGSSMNSSSVIKDDNIREIINEAYSDCFSNLSNIMLNIETYQNISSTSLKERHKEFNSAINNVYDIIDNLTSYLSVLETSLINYFFSSCSQALSKDSSYLSGNYILRSSTGALRSVYCDMTNRFGGDSKGWMRVTKLDVNNCPPGFIAHTSGSIKTCVVSDNNAGCTEIVYSTAKIYFTKITGQIRGYQIGTLDGFIGINDPPRSMNISANYVDGLSVTFNNEHVWTFAAGCDCNSMKPDTIGSNYVCDEPSPSCSAGSFCSTHLWESQKCGNPSSPWFLRTLDRPTAANIKVRVCRDQGRDDEDLAISKLELYLQ